MNPDLEARIRSLPAGISLKWDEELDDYDAAFSARHRLDTENIDFASEDVKAMYDKGLDVLGAEFLRSVNAGEVEAFTDSDFEEEEGDEKLFSDDPDLLPDAEDAP